MAASPTTSITFQNFFSTTLTSDITNSATDIFLNAVPNGSEGFLVIDPDNSTYREVIYYNSKTASKVICPSAADGRGQDDTSAAAHTAGTTVIMAPIAAYFETLLALFTTSPQGWTSLSGTFTSPTALGNRSYTITTSVDQTAILSRGMRIRTTRTVTAPTQCTSLNGTTQYYSKASPNKSAFTDDFVAFARIKPSSYALGTIISVYNGTSGWALRMTATGQIQLVGYNAGAANFSQILSYQSVPLNRWTNIYAQLDMSSFTNTPTTSFVMMDELDVPGAVTRGGTNPTALVQAGNLNVGAENGGTNPFPGKLAQAGWYTAKVTQATLRASASQTLAGTETSIGSAYSFNNVITDLNTTTPNDLTAQGSAVATNSDSPFAVPDTGTPGGTYDYAIVTNITASTLTVQVPEGCAIPTSGGITAASYSTYKSPFGFPTTAARWAIRTLINSQYTQASPVASTWYNVGSFQMTIPIGEWIAGYQVIIYGSRASGSDDMYITLSTGASSETDKEWTGQASIAAATDVNASIYTRQYKSLTAATLHYINMKTTAAGLNGIYMRGDSAICTAFAEFAYL